jgi:N6-adenosine-specific RNA methylase IME4
MKLDAICDLLRGSKAVSHDAVLFLWVPASLIADGLKVIEAWGFRCFTHAIWHKGGERHGLVFPDEP